VRCAELSVGNEPMVGTSTDDANLLDTIAGNGEWYARYIPTVPIATSRG
jgi:hypothetical protein